MSAGLTSHEARKRLMKYGSNEIRRTKKPSVIKMFASQFVSPLILILIAAAVISVAIGFFPGQKPNLMDAALILIIVSASGISGFFQDYKAEKTIEALKQMATPKAKVIRDGKEIEIDARDIVPGDLILLEAGDIVPADAKLLETFGLKLDESILTGESHAVEKKRSDIIWMNTFVSVGDARALVTATGMRTEVGKIADKIQRMEEESTPFQTEISSLSKKVFWIIAAIMAVMFFISILKYNLYQSLLTAIALAIAAIPEGLPAVIVLALAIGAKGMARKSALVRKIAVTESIGAVDIICTDKTGTLTKNEMSVTKLFMNGKVFDPSWIGKAEAKVLKPLLLCGALCNNSSRGYDSNGNRVFLGDQTEIALRKISDKFGFVKEKLEKEYDRIDEQPFTSKRKMMSVIFRHNFGKHMIYSKGAPEVLIKRCSKLYRDGRTVRLTEAAKKKILEQNKKFASGGLRVLGFAFNNTKSPAKSAEKALVWLGLQGITDPPRKEVKQALKDCRAAGIRVIMLTGDNPLTARAVADGIGLQSKGIMQGKELDRLSDKELKARLDSGLNIFARISPFHKLRILKLLKKDARVAMTGDGVNDALALKNANVGVAMEIRGTEVAKEASDMILLNDNFATITAAIKEGRRIFDNIRKFINYLFVCNFAEVAVLFLATLFLVLKEPILLPVQILWINLLTDGMPALALGVDPPRPDIMLKPPRNKDEPLINRRLGWLIGAIGIKKTAVLFATFFLILPISIEAARTALFTGFVLYEFVRIGSIRYQEKLNWFANKWLIVALAGSILLQLIIVYTPLNAVFHIVPLGLYEWAVLLVGILIGYVSAIAITKAVMKFIKG